MPLSDRLALLITANVDDAVKGFKEVGKAAERDLGKAEKRLDKVGANMVSIGAGAVALGGVAAVGLYKLGQSASDLNEVTSQSEQIFDSAEGKIAKFAEGAAKSLGQSEKAARDGANTFGLFFTNAGKSADEAADMSIELTKLASDFASFKNTSPEQAIEAIGAALRGESEPIRAYGVMLDEATLKQRALDMGLVKTTKQTLPPAVKMQAAYAEILAQTGTIQGDFARTSDSAANQQRIFTAEMENLKASVGEGVLPAMTNMIKLASGAAEAFGNLDEGTKGAAGTLATYTTAALLVGGATSTVIGQVIKMRENFGAAVGGIKNFAGSLQGARAVAAGGFAAGIGIAAFALYEFQRAAKAAERGSDALTQAAEAAGDGLSDTLTKELNKLASGLPSIFDDALGESADKFSDFSNDFGLSISEIVAGLSGSEAEFERFKKGAIDAAVAVDGSSARASIYADDLDTLRSSFEGATEAQSKATRGAEELGIKNETATGQTGEMAEAVSETKSELELAKEALDRFNEGIDTYLGKTFGVQDATDEFQGSLNKLKDLVEETDGKFTGASDAAIGFRDAQEDIVAGAAGVLTSMAEQGASTDEVRKRQKELADQYYLTAIANGVPKAMAELYRQAILNIPTERRTRFYADASQATGELEAYRRILNDVIRLESGRIIGSADSIERQVQASGRARGGPVTKGHMYIVGEKRPELFVPNQNGTIIPRVPTGSGGSSFQQVNHITIAGPDPQANARAVVAALERYERSMAGATASVE